ncbi:Vacuolar protein sorting-associated protein ist1, partial [Coemansia sp. 'formosensis']
GYNVDFRSYNHMGHSTCDDELLHLQLFLKQRIPEKQAKKSSLYLKARCDTAPLLEAGKVVSTTIRVESIIREDLNIEALEMVELYCELLLACAGLVDQSRAPAKPSTNTYTHRR